MRKSAGTSKANSQVVKRTDKRPDPIHGFLFQLKLLMLFLYRGVTGGYSFTLGTEIEEAKKFDDLVFEFTQNKKKFYRLLQAKHKFDRTRSSISTDSLFNEINGDFNLPKYFFSYLDAKKENLFEGGIIKDVIICTNINFDDQVFKNKDIKIQRIKNKDYILEIKLGCLTKPIRYKFKEDILPILKQHLNNYKSKSKRMLSDYNDDDVKDFINHLIFAVDCPNEQELGEIIKGEIGKEFDFHDVDNIYSRFMMTMLEWLQGKERGRFISDKEGKQFFEEAKKGIPVLFNIRSPVESFTGRCKELDILHKLLKDPTDKNQAICITGIGGVGKSELVRKYISEFRMEYSNNVLWLNAESYQALEASFRSLASNKLGIITKNADGEEKGLMSVIEEVYRAFSNRNCLIIFDNALHYRSKNEFDDGIDRFLPPFSDVSRPYILITSRNRKWPSTIHILSLDTFEKDEAIQFISKVLKTDINESSALADEMEYFPLALQQAVSFIKVQNMKLQNIGSHFNITSYLNRLKEKSKDVLNFPFPEDSDIDYTKTVYITWNVTLDLIRKSENGKEALKIMNILSYMATEDVPIDIFLNVVNGYDALSCALDILKQYSMIMIHHKIISLEQQIVMVNVHGLVQEVIRLKLVEEKKNKLVLEEALMIFTKRENVNENTLNHAISVWDYSSKDGLLSEDKRRYGSLVSTYISIELLKSNRYTQLYSFGKEAIALYSSFPKDDKGVQGCLMILKQNEGIALRVLGKYKNAMKNFEEVLSSSGTMHGIDNPYSLMVKSFLAETLLKEGNYSEAIELSSQLIEKDPLSSDGKLTLAKALSSQGKDDEALGILNEVKKNINQSDSTDSKEFLAHVLHLEGKFEDSLHLYQTLDYSKNDNSIKTHKDLDKKFNIAQLYFAQKKYTEALKEFKEVVEIGRKSFGENHPETLYSQSIIAEILRRQSKFDKALKLFEKTHEKQKTVLGKDHPDTLQTLFGKAITLEDQEKFNDSLRIYQEVLEKRITKFGKDHPSSLEARTSVGDIFFKLKDFDKALEKYNEVLSIKKKAKRKADNLDLMIKIGKVYFNKSEIDRALTIFKDAIKVIKDTSGSDHSEYIPVSTHIAKIYKKQGKYDLAIEYFKNIFEIKKKQVGEDDPGSLAAKYEIAMTLSLKEEYNESLKIYRELLKKMNGILGNDHPRSLAVRNNISAILLLQDKFDEALRECKTSMEIQNLNPERNEGNITVTKKILVEIFSKQNKHEEVLKLLTETLETQESLLSKNPLSIADTKSEIAKSLIRLNKPQRAIKFIRESFLTFKAVLGTEHPKTVMQKDVLQYLSAVEELFTAVKQNKNTEFIKELVASGCDFDTQDDEGRTLLHHAVNQGNIETVRYLLAIGVDFTQVTEKGNSCLHVAVLKGNGDIVKVLLKHLFPNKSKELIDIRTNLGGMTALHVAAKNDNLDLVKTLLHYGAKYNILDNDKKRPVDLAKDKEVKSILQLVEENFKFVSCGGIKADEINALKKEDLLAVVNARNEKGQTLLQVASINGDQLSARGLSEILQKMKII
ncbi:uncharacterized protein [Halyomorpha halys]|uniref:uncharacterized protein n=1 Tax=Halyomorpha halys TaxID=286706 RepID=UPI0006D51E05|nr:uncharacterized protein LOC106677816 [Halyomorpha halys]XP_014271441.1 uncharacterized protein LOC106677816 [Halyomorpha halys]